MKIALFLFTVLISLTSNAQQRVIEDSIVYNDPTVAKGGKWVSGILLGGYYSNADSSVTNSDSIDIKTKQKYTQPGAEGFIGYSDFTLIGRYQKKNVTISVPNTSSSSSTTMKEDGHVYSVDLRYLAIPLQQKYFVPYGLLSYTTSHSGVEFNTYSNGTQKRNFNHAKGPGIGVGALIPITDRYGVRVDIRQYQLKTYNTSNYSTAIESRNLEYRQVGSSAYYNLTDKMTMQLGATYAYLNNISNSNRLGLSFSVGVKF